MICFALFTAVAQVKLLPTVPNVDSLLSDACLNKKSQFIFFVIWYGRSQVAVQIFLHLLQR